MEMTPIGWFKWYKYDLDGPEIFDTNPDFKGRLSRDDLKEFFYNRSANIMLHRVKLTDTGIYICQVEFEHNSVISGHGNGTFLCVTDSTDCMNSTAPTAYSKIPEYRRILLIIFCVVGMFSIIGVGAFIYFCHIIRKASQAREMTLITYCDFTMQASPELEGNIINYPENLFGFNNTDHTLPLQNPSISGTLKADFPSPVHESSSATSKSFWK
ncbi:uncharacterized protein O3C94_015099 [Discoglossus pictus]